MVSLTPFFGQDHPETNLQVLFLLEGIVLLDRKVLLREEHTHSKGPTLNIILLDLQTFW